jgi:hypothetical protein
MSGPPPSSRSAAYAYCNYYRCRQSLTAPIQVGAQEGVIAALLQIIGSDGVEMYVRPFPHSRCAPH